ncbi:tetratricopeptide repeat protein [Polaribacter vadi]|uniref:SH3 domain-containing protein n=1 Tax=Polaribacter TaxID=52959 RepID=UPI001C0940B2|nr:MULTISPECIES: tetratricopeptide repeat protein [Polaribacter]MBU3011583.1 tetratricopeptide repeat protein [Polaribacter vadi]MDO6741396.1 tetratricopeptide repeat protein [Polaribacter sp. 1_MG-2023]
MKKILFLLLIIANSVIAQNTEELFKSANELYKNEQLAEAIELYKKIENQGLVSSELFYNLGNAYYKLNKVGPSIYYYEKALLLNPLNEDVQNNLVFAKRLALDNIEELPKTVFQKININILQKLSYNQWAIVAIIFSFLGGIFFLFFYFASTPSKKRFYFITSSLSFILLIFSFFITYNQYTFAKNNKVAIVFAEKTEVRNAPTLNSEEVFTLHEGTKVVVLDAIDDWKKIKIADGKLGWIIADEVKELN